MRKNKPLLIGWIVSIVLHGTLFISFFFQPDPTQHADVEIDFIHFEPPAEPESVVENRRIIPVPKDVSIHQEPVEKVINNTFPEPQQSVIPPDTIPYITHESLVLNSVEFKTRQILTEHPELKVNPEPVIIQSGPIYTRPDGLEKKENILLKLFGTTVDPSLDFIPTETQVKALDIIFENEEITDIGIYAQMDTSFKVTAQDLITALDFLTEKGIVTRKVVSPQNKFRFFILPEEWGIEMSAKNRKNRIYEYQAQIDREQLLNFLNASLYQVDNGMSRFFNSTLDSSSLSNNIKKDILHLAGK
ncbi:hypothetical protein JW935_26085 [candidate division KSB1 bacterium]|nr:hypothetical protein [candidate division KSB1 bacterium]